MNDLEACVFTTLNDTYIINLEAGTDKGYNFFLHLITVIKSYQLYMSAQCKYAVFYYF